MVNNARVFRGAGVSRGRDLSPFQGWTVLVLRSRGSALRFAQRSPLATFYRPLRGQRAGSPVCGRTLDKQREKAAMAVCAAVRRNVLEMRLEKWREKRT